MLIRHLNRNIENVAEYASLESGERSELELEKGPRYSFMRVSQVMLAVRFYPWVRKTPLEEGMVTHSSVLAWKIPWTEEPGRLWSIRSRRVIHD